MAAFAGYIYLLCWFYYSNKKNEFFLYILAIKNPINFLIEFYFGVIVDHKPKIV